MNKFLPQSRFKYGSNYDYIFNKDTPVPTKDELRKWIEHARAKNKRVYMEPDQAEALLDLWQGAETGDVNKTYNALDRLRAG